MNISRFSSNRIRAGLFAGAAALFAAAPAANAAIVAVDRTSAPISIINNIDGVYLNVVTGATGTSGAAVPGWDIDPYSTSGSGSFIFFSPSSPSNQGVLVNGSQAMVLNAGNPISSASSYHAGVTSAADFQTEGTHFVGFRFLNEATTVLDYGWLRISNGATGGFPAFITAYGYDDSGASITAGAGLQAAVPVPVTPALILGGLAAMGWAARSRRQNQASSAAI
jgi:hypothetical protein